MPLLRAGTLRTLDLEHFGGAVTFPSFHAAAAILYAWALWPLRWVRPFSLAVNGLMLVATPIGGGHYLVDVLAGVMVAAGSISAARFAARLLDVPGQGSLADVVTCQVVAGIEDGGGHQSETEPPLQRPAAERFVRHSSSGTAVAVPGPSPMIRSTASSSL